MTGSEIWPSLPTNATSRRALQRRRLLRTPCGASSGWRPLRRQSSTPDRRSPSPSASVTVASAGLARTDHGNVDLEYAERTLLSHRPVPPRWSDGLCQPFASDHVGPLSLRPSRTRREMTRNGPGRAIAQWRVGVVGEPERARRFFREATGVRPAGFVHPDAARCEIGQRPVVPSAFRCAETRPASRTGPAGDPAELSVQVFQRAATERAGPSRRSRRRPGANRPARMSAPDRDDRSKSEEASESTDDSNMREWRVRCSVSTFAIIASSISLGPGDSELHRYDLDGRDPPVTIDRRESELNRAECQACGSCHKDLSRIRDPACTPTPLRS